MKHAAITVGLIMVLTLSGLAGEDPFADETVRKVQALHDEAVAGGKDQTEALVTELDRLLESDPKNTIFLAYLGSAYTLRSRDAFPGPSKFSFLKNGLKTMDRAVNMEPKNPAPRFIRAMNNFSLPAIINRRDNAREDFEVLLSQIEDPSNPFQLRESTRQAIYYFAGLSFQQLDRESEARAAWDKGLRLKASPEFTEKITSALANLND